MASCECWLSLFQANRHSPYHYYYYSFKGWLIVFKWSLSDRNSSQISRNILSILADFNNTSFLMFSTYPIISKFSSPCTNLLRIVSCEPIAIDNTVTFMFFNFLVLWQGLGIYHSFLLLLILLFRPPVSASPQFSRFSFFVVDYHSVWLSRRD